MSLGENFHHGHGCAEEALLVFKGEVGPVMVMAWIVSFGQTAALVCLDILGYASHHRYGHEHEPPCLRDIVHHDVIFSSNLIPISPWRDFSS